MTTNITVVTKTPDPLWLRIAKPLLLVGAVYGLYAFLAERSIFEPALIVLFSAIAYWVQTGGRGLPIPLPKKLEESAGILRQGIGENAWRWLAADSRVWTLLQSIVFGIVAAVVQGFIVDALTRIMPADYANFIGTTLAVTLCSFALGLLIRKMAAQFGVRPWVEDLKAALKRAFNLPTFGKVGPVGWLAIWSLVRAITVQLLKMWAIAGAAELFTGPGALIFIGAVTLALIVVPDSVKGFVGRLKSNEKKTEVSDE